VVEKTVNQTYLFKDNAVFWTSFSLFLIVGGLSLLTQEQGTWLEYFSANRHTAIDYFFKYATKIGEEPTYLLFIIICLFIRFRYAILIPLLGIIVTIISFITKSFFLHPRPSIYYRDLGQLEGIQTVEGVHLLGGLTSFPSGHTMSAFALFSFVAFLFPKKGFFNLLFFLFALLVGISRIYLVQHFLKDIYLGAIVGVIIGGSLYLLQQRRAIDEEGWMDRRVGGFNGEWRIEN